MSFYSNSSEILNPIDKNIAEYSMHSQSQPRAEIHRNHSAHLPWTPAIVSYLCVYEVCTVL